MINEYRGGKKRMEQDKQKTRIQSLQVFVNMKYSSENGNGQKIRLTFQRRTVSEIWTGS